MIRSITAVVFGYVVLMAAAMLFLALGLGGDPDAAPGLSRMIVGLAYAFVAAALAGYLTAWIARRGEVRHAVLLAVLGGAFGSFYVLASSGLAPLGFQIAKLVVLVAGVLLGGFLRGASRARTGAPRATPA